MKRNCSALVLLAFSTLAAVIQAADPASVRGWVANSLGGERLERVRVRLLPLVEGLPQRAEMPGGARAFETATNERGEFLIDSIPPGRYEITVSTVGYRLHHQALTLEPAQKVEFEIALSPEAFTQRETIEVSERVFDPLEPMTPTERTLTHSEVKNLGSVLADDPLRAVQAMPGVSTGDDFEARFAIRGAAFENIGIFLDGVLMHSPFHTLHLREQSGSITMLNGDMIESLSLLTGGFSARYGDRTAGVVTITSREGGRNRPSARIVASASNAGALAEGPLGSAHKGSWMAGFRKSYLDYIIRRTSSDPSVAFGFLDGQGRVVYDLAPRYQVSLHVSSGQSGLDRSHFKGTLGPRALMNSEGRESLGILGLRYTQGPRFLLNTTLAAIRETYLEWNPQHVPLASGRYRETAGRAEGTLYWRPGAALEFGAEVRRLHDEMAATDYASGNPGRYFEFARFKGAGWIQGGYLQQTWQYQRLRLGAGVRFDRLAPGDCASAARPPPSSGGSAAFASACRAEARSTYSPRLSLAVPLPFNQSLRLGWGQYRQFPEAAAMFGTAGNPGLTAAHATHYLAAWEWQLQERTRISVEAFDREDRQGIIQPWFEPRMQASGKFTGWNYADPFQNSLTGYSRGVEFLLQRRSANRLTGWLSYSYAHTHMRDTITGRRFVAEYDQPHTFNAYASYRIRPSVNLSGKWLYGSGFPMPAYLRQDAAGRYYLGLDPYRLRLDPYQRLDARVNKSLLFARRRLTLYAEVINVLNRRNLRFSQLDSFNSKTGVAYPRFDRMFPIIPSIGAVFEF